MALPDMNAYFMNDQLSFAAFLFSSTEGQMLCALSLLCAYVFVRVAKNSNQLADEFSPTPGNAGFVIVTIAIFIAIGLFMGSPDAFIYYRF